MTAADQPTTEPSVQTVLAQHFPHVIDSSDFPAEADLWCACQSGDDSDQALASWVESADSPDVRDLFKKTFANHQAQVLADAGLLAPAPQPAAEQQCTACDGRGDEGSTYMNSGKCQTCHGTGSQLAADTETEVQWGVRYVGWEPDVMLPCVGPEEAKHRRDVMGDGFTIVSRTATYTPWEEA